MVEATLGSARFFRRSGPYPLAVVARTARGVADELELLLEGVAPLQTAGPNEVSFLDNRHYASALDQTLAGAVIVHPDMASRVPTTTVAIVTSEPYAAWARVAALFYPVPPPSPGIHPSAIVADGALVDPSAEVGPLCCDRDRSRDRTWLSDRALRSYRKRGDCRSRLPDWRTCEPELRAFGSTRLRLSWCPDRTGRVWIRRHQRWIYLCPPAWASHSLKTMSKLALIRRLIEDRHETR